MIIYSDVQYKNCRVCGIRFLTYYTRQIFCSAPCRLYFNNERTKQNYLTGKAKQRVKNNQADKLKTVKNNGCICPGCGVDFSKCIDKALLLIFDRCHIHTKNCKDRLENAIFYACRDCNGWQSKKCGYWEKPGIFKQVH